MAFREAPRSYVSELGIIKCKIAQMEGLTGHCFAPKRRQRFSAERNERTFAEHSVTRTNYTRVINSANYLRNECPPSTKANP